MCFTVHCNLPVLLSRLLLGLTIPLPVMQNIYLFAPEGSKQDRGRLRPSSATPSSPAKRARTANSHDDNDQDRFGDTDGVAEGSEPTDADMSKTRVSSSSSQQGKQMTAAYAAPSKQYVGLLLWLHLKECCMLCNIRTGNVAMGQLHD